MTEVTQRWRSERVTAAIYDAGVKHDSVATVGFDLCVTYNGLHCLPDPRTALGELARVLRPRGTVRGTSCVTGRGTGKDALIALFRRARVFGNAPHTGDIDQWLRQFGLEVVTLEPSGAVEFFEARLPRGEQTDR